MFGQVSKLDSLRLSLYKVKLKFRTIINKFSDTQLLLLSRYFIRTLKSYPLRRCRTASSFLYCKFSSFYFSELLSLFPFKQVLMTYLNSISHKLQSCFIQNLWFWIKNKILIFKSNVMMTFISNHIFKNSKLCNRILLEKKASEKNTY